MGFGKFHWFCLGSGVSEMGGIIVCCSVVGSGWLPKSVATSVLSLSSSFWLRVENLLLSASSMTSK